MRPITAPAATPTAAVSPWHSPVPYLFGGLAAMMGLIALALLILACSYWKLNNYLGTDSSSGAGTGATDGDGSKSPATAAAASPAVFADLVAVVMAGEKMPTFLAAPIVHRSVVADSAAAGESTPELADDEKSNHGKAGSAEGGDVTASAGGERSQQLDQV